MSDEKSAEEVWEENNRAFRYQEPDGHPETWSQEEYTELHDRVITRRVEWVCQKCSQPFRSVEEARRHVGRQHGERLYEKYGDDDE